MTDGWTRSKAPRQKRHYYRADESLCGRWWVVGPWFGGEDFDQDDTDPTNCKECLRLRHKEEED